MESGANGRLGRQKGCLADLSKSTKRQSAPSFVIKINLLLIGRPPSLSHLIQLWLVKIFSEVICSSQLVQMAMMWRLPYICYTVRGTSTFKGYLCILYEGIKGYVMSEVWLEQRLSHIM